MRHVAVVNAVYGKGEPAAGLLGDAISVCRCRTRPWALMHKTPARGLLVRSCILLPVPLFALVPALFFLPPCFLLSLQPDLVRLGAVVHERLLEPGVLQGFLGCDALLGVVHEYPSEEVKELFVEVGVARYCFLCMSVKAGGIAGGDVHGASSSP